jgi:hypothetical protein
MSESYVLDPRTDEPWKYKIPRSCFLEKPNQAIVDVFAEAAKTWDELRNDILARRRSQAIENGKFS